MAINFVQIVKSIVTTFFFQDNFAPKSETRSYFVLDCCWTNASIPKRFLVGVFRVTAEGQSPVGGERYGPLSKLLFFAVSNAITSAHCTVSILLSPSRNQQYRKFRLESFCLMRNELETSGFQNCSRILEAKRSEFSRRGESILTLPNAVCPPFANIRVLRAVWPICTLPFRPFLSDVRKSKRTFHELENFFGHKISKS